MVSDVQAAALPDQNQLFTYYASRCGRHLVGKPNSSVLQLLAEDERSHAVRLAYEAAERGVAIADLADIEGDTEDDQRRRKCVIPLAHRKVFRLPPSGVGRSSTEVYVGARGMLALLDLLAELPLLESIDLSNVASWYTSDTFACRTRGNGDNSGGKGQDGSELTGNMVVVRLCEVVAGLPRVVSVDITGQPLGTLAAHSLLDLVQASPRITRLLFTRNDVDSRLYHRIEQTLERNAKVAAGTNGTAAAPVLLPTTLSPRLVGLPVTDRKTVREQQVLRAILQSDANFSKLVSGEDLSEMVLHARVMSTSEVVSRCSFAASSTLQEDALVGGLRGDGYHLFILKSGSIRAMTDLEGFVLHRGDYFGDTYGSEVLFPSCQLVEEERGTVYCLPLVNAGALLCAWRLRVRSFYAQVRTTPLLQPVCTWVRMRVCTCSTLVEVSSGTVVVSEGDDSRALYIVLGNGTFYAMPATSVEVRDITGRYTPHALEKSDVFGVESIVSRRPCSSVSIVAGKEKGGTYICAQVMGSATHLLGRQLWSVFVSLARQYSCHEELWQVARKPVEGGVDEVDMYYI